MSRWHYLKDWALFLRVSAPLAGGHYRPMAKTKKHRQRFDTMIDAHIGMRQAARTQGEWPTTELYDAPRLCVDWPYAASDNLENWIDATNKKAV
jgi:hypothetical protein